MPHIVIAVLASVVVATTAPEGVAQQPTPLDSLLAEADRLNPRIRESREAAEAAGARVPQAGAHPDPVLGLGFVNLPIADPGFGSEMMTMTQLQLSTRLPWPGKLRLQEQVAELRAEAAGWEVERVRDAVRSEVKAAYYELYFLNRAISVTERNRTLLDDLATLSASRYAVGEGAQPDVLKAQVERSRLTEQLVTLRERRATTLAGLNALLSRASDTPVEAVELPRAVRTAARTGDPEGPTFRSDVIASAASRTSGPLPGVDELQALALEQSPMIRAHLRRVAAQEEALALAERQKLPDLSVGVGYARRAGRSDFFSVSLSAPLPIFAGRKQDEGVREQSAVVAEHRALHGTMVNRLNEEIAGHVAELRRARDRLTLLEEAILPQARTGLASATSAYRVGSVDFLTVLDAQVTLYRQELDHHRLLADFATHLAALERAVGTEVLR